MPMVGHRLLPEKAVPLVDVLKNIKEAAFVTSPYPVIIHLELQCRSPYQEKAIEIIQSMLGADKFVILDRKSVV